MGYSRPIVVDGRVVGIACSRGRPPILKCSVCRKRDGTQLCDGRDEACSAPLCHRCATRDAQRRDFCPECAARENVVASSGKVDLGMPRTVR